jgi:hypothetical protein
LCNMVLRGTADTPEELFHILLLPACLLVDQMQLASCDIQRRPAIAIRTTSFGTQCWSRGRALRQC